MWMVPTEATKQEQLGKSGSRDAAGGPVAREPMLAQGHQSHGETTLRLSCFRPSLLRKIQLLYKEVRLSAGPYRSPSGEIPAGNEAWLICPGFIQVISGSRGIWAQQGKPVVGGCPLHPPHYLLCCMETLQVDPTAAWDLPASAAKSRSFSSFCL